MEGQELGGGRSKVDDIIVSGFMSLLLLALLGMLSGYCGGGDNNPNPRSDRTFEQTLW